MISVPKVGRHTLFKPSKPRRPKNAAMSEPKATMTGLCLRAVCERLPSGALGKLAFVSKEFRNACEEEEMFRAKKPRRIPLHTSVCLLTTEGEVQWAVDRGCPVDAALAKSLAFGGSVPALKKAVEMGAPTDNLCFYAAKGGHLEVLKWLRENGCPWDSCTCYSAAKGGHLEVLKWLRENGCPWDSNTCAHAAQGGHLEVLKWARQNGCHWAEWTCLLAAEGGHLEVLKWARQEGCPWHECTCLLAAALRRFDVLKWAIDNGAPWEEHRFAIFNRVRGTDYEDWFRGILSQHGY